MKFQQLEHELGGPLFHRERGNTHLSELGRMMFRYLQSVEEQAKAAREQAKAIWPASLISCQILFELGRLPIGGIPPQNVCLKSFNQRFSLLFQCQGLP